MATVYLKKVSSSSRSEWVSGTSYVVGDRVWIEDSSLVVSYTNVYGDQNKNAIRTYVCIKDTSSATSPLSNTTDWTEAGTKEYPYHSVGGNLTDSSISPESYLESTNDRAHSDLHYGSLFHHLKRGESGYSLGKLIILADEENPLFIATTALTFNQFEVEPDHSIKRVRIHMNDASIGSNVGHNDPDSTFGRAKKCDFYYSGYLPANNFIGGIYNNLNKIEFDECYFGEATRIGLSPIDNPLINMGTRNFLGLNRCTIDFPNSNTSYIIWDAQNHSNGVSSYIKNSTIRFKSVTSSYNILVYTSVIDIENSIFYASELQQDIFGFSSTQAYAATSVKNFVAYFRDEGAFTFDENAGAFTGTVTKIDPLFVDDSGDYRLRPNSPLIGGFETSARSKLESQYPDGKWFDSNAAAGGDGSWETPYHSLFDTIDSFSGVNTATVLVKEGDHPMYQGWDNSISGTPAQVHSKIEIIGINSNVRFTSENNLNSYVQFFTGGGTFNDTEFFYKNIDFHINNTSSYLNRGVIFNPKRNKLSLHQCKVSQSSTGEIMSAAVFYQPGTDVGNPAEIELIGLEYIAVTWRPSHVEGSAIFNTDCKVIAKNCTFLEPERSMLRTNHSVVKSIFLGKPHNQSIFENCIFRSDIEYGTGGYGSRQFFSPQANFYSGINSNLGLFKNCSISSKYGSFTDNASYDFRLYNHQENCSYEDPKFVNAALGSEDIRLQSSSPLIGGIAGNSSEEKWIARATKENKTYAFFDPAATGTGDGSSLANACNDLFEAIAAVDFGGYIFVADMDHTFSSSVLIDKPVIIQALNSGKAIWRVTTPEKRFLFYPTGYQMYINTTSGDDQSNTFAGTPSTYTKNVDGYYKGMIVVFDGSSTTAQANDAYTITDHTYDGTTHTFTFDKPLNGAVTGSVRLFQELSTAEDIGARDMVLIDFNTGTGSNGNGVTFQIDSKTSDIASTTSYKNMVFERNKILQTSNITGGYKTGLHFRNDKKTIISNRFVVKGNAISVQIYPGNAQNKAYPTNLGQSNIHTDASLPSGRIISNNSIYFYSNLDSSPSFTSGHNTNIGENNIFVVENLYNNAPGSNASTIDMANNNYYSGFNNGNLNGNPFIDAINGDFRIRPNSELIGKGK